MSMVAPGYRIAAFAPRGTLGIVVSSGRPGAKMGVNGMASSVTVPKLSMAPAVSLLWNRWNWVSSQGSALCLAWRYPGSFLQSFYPYLLSRAFPYPILCLLSTLTSRRWLGSHSFSGFLPVWVTCSSICF